MTLGWDEYPDKFIPYFDFDRAPFWLRLLSRTWFLEKFAYPGAVKRGFGTLKIIPWKPCMCEPPCEQPTADGLVTESDIELATQIGWKVDQSRMTLLSMADLGIYPYARLKSVKIRKPSRRFTKEGRRKARFRFNREAHGYLGEMYYDELV